MLSLRIVDSVRFLQMPLTAHALYFHLALHADDDGVVDLPRGPDKKNPAGAGVKAVEVDGFAGSERVLSRPAATGIDDCLSLQLRIQLSKPWTKLGTVCPL
jgi:hypothetical protein